MHDSLHALTWMLTLLGLGAAFWPVSARVFPHFQDRGLGLSIPLGLLLYGLGCRVFWALGLLNPSPAFHLLLLGLMAALLWWKLPPPTLSPRTWRRTRNIGLHAGLVLFGSFLLWLSIRSADPGVAHTEQPMDLMLLQAALHSGGPGIPDPWLTGEDIVYYTAGHLLLAHLAQLAGSPAELAVNFGQAAWFGLIALLVFLVAGAWQGRRAQGFSFFSGWIAVIAVLWTSNLAGAIDVLKGRTTEPWWWWNATRCVQDPGADGGTVELITEFPFFSFWLGDNHAHLLSIPFLLLALATALHLQRRRQPGLPDAAILGSCLGMSWAANAWQAPTVLAITVLAFTLHPVRAFNRRLLACAAVFVFCAVAINLPGILQGGDAMFEGIASTPKGAYTSFKEKLLVFGLILPAALAVFAQGWKRMPFAISLLVLCGCIVAVCDQLMIVDLFQNRMNTVFKAYYQVWILLGILGGIGAGHLLRSPHPAIRLAAAALLLPLAFGMLYPATLCGTAIAKPVQSLNAVHALDPETRALVDYGIARIRPGDLVIEAEGESYNPGSALLSTWTPGQGLIGWTGHEHQWHPREYSELLQPRIEALRAIYEAHTPAELEEQLSIHSADWVLLGPREHGMYAIHRDWPLWMAERFDRPIHSETYTLFRRRR